LGNFHEHITQSKSNLDFLNKLNVGVPDSWDWQVTVCFYTALHLISAHVVNKTGKNYLSHTSINDAINPTTQLSIAKLDETTYLAYNKLYQLSRRSRYLISEDRAKNNNPSGITNCNLTYSIHFKRSINHLEIVMNYMIKNYSITFEKCKIKCLDLNSLNFNNFTIEQI
jgi:hypothetical protein